MQKGAMTSDQSHTLNLDGISSCISPPDSPLPSPYPCGQSFFLLQSLVNREDVMALVSLPWQSERLQGLKHYLRELGFYELITICSLQLLT